MPAVSARAKPAADTAAAPGPWVIGPLADSILVLGAPLLCAALLLPLAGALGSAAVWGAVMTFGAVGHHLPGFLRTYGDRALFRRYRFRFLLAPPFFFAAFLWAASRNLHGVALLSLVWSTWHGMMQHYGFLRIYDAKVGQVSPRAARLDLAMTVAWFSLCIAWGPTLSSSLLAGIADTAGVVVPSGVWRALAVGSAIGAAIVTALYLGSLARARARGEAVSSRKLVLLVTTTALVWFARVVTTDPLLSVALFEVVHDAQYLAIVWAVNRRAADRGGDLGRAGSWLFGPGGGRATTYVLACLAYGGVAFATHRLVDGHAFKTILVALLSTSGVLHFYFDGFIWKVSESDVRRGLDLDRAEVPRAARATQATAPRWRSALYAMRYTAPVAALLAVEMIAPERDSLAIASGLAEVVPRSATAQNNLGAEWMERGRADLALEPLRRAVELQPELLEARSGLGVALLQTGHVDEAVLHLREAARLGPERSEPHENLADALLAQGAARPAIASYQEAIARGSTSAKLRNNLGYALAREGRTDEAYAAYAEALRLSPDFAGARLNLGLLLDALGRPHEALPHLREAARLQPNAPEVHNNLGGALEKMGLLDEAEAAYARALDVAPDFPPAQHNLRRVRARPRPDGDPR